MHIHMYMYTTIQRFGVNINKDALKWLKVTEKIYMVWYGINALFRTNKK